MTTVGRRARKSARGQDLAVSQRTALAEASEGVKTYTWITRHSLSVHPYHGRKLSNRWAQ